MDSEANEPIEEPVETIEEPAEESAEKKPAPKVTSTVKKTKPMKNPGRVAEGKRLAQHNRKVKEVKAKLTWIQKLKMKMIEILLLLHFH